MILFKQTIKRIFKSKVKVGILLIAPIIFIIMFASNGQKTTNIGIVDKDNSFSSGYLTEYIKGIDTVKVVMLEEKNLIEKTAGYNVEYSIVIDNGFEKNLMLGQDPLIHEFYLTEKEKLFYVKAYLNNQITNMEALARGTGYDIQLFKQAVEQYKAQGLNISNLEKVDGNIPKERLSLGFLVQFMLYMGLVTTGLMLEDKATGTFLRSFYAPVSLKRYIGENFAAYLISAAIQVTVAILTMRFLFNMDFNGHIISVYALMLIFAVTCIAMGIWIISLFRKALHAYIFIFAAASPLAMLGGCYWPANMAPEIMRKIGYFMPTTWVMDGIDKILYESKDLTGMALNILILFIFSALFLSAGLIKRVEAAKA